jgi:hypothetical protein
VLQELEQVVQQEQLEVRAQLVLLVQQVLVQQVLQELEQVVQQEQLVHKDLQVFQL